ncbi:MAG TPA: 50S ribosomal protein L29 [Acidimicrobiia bacterium]|nr:50S ribosomal protein L29 [Acidimicrobiia bacterium]
MSIADLRELSTEELMEALVEAKEERFNLRFQVATNQLDNTARLKAVKKEIARILTVMRERDMKAATEVAAAEESA